MRLDIKCDSIEVTPVSGAHIDVSVDGVDAGNVIDQIGIERIVTHYENDEIISAIGEKECIDEIQISRVLDIIGIDDCIDHFTERKLFDRFNDDSEVLDMIGIKRVKEYFNLTEKED